MAASGAPCPSRSSACSWAPRAVRRAAFSGFFSKDEILALVAERGGGWPVLTVVGYLAALLTAIYTFRLIFRVFWGEPCPEARELEEATSTTPRCTSTRLDPTEIEDTDVGFPAPTTFVAEREMPMKIAMGLLAWARRPAGRAAALRPDHRARHVPRATFADSRYFDQLTPSTRSPASARDRRDARADRHLHRLYGLGAPPGHLGGADRAVPRLHRLLVNQWYFDQLLDVLFVRPTAWFGRWAQSFLRARRRPGHDRRRRDRAGARRVGGGPPRAVGAAAGLRRAAHPRMTGLALYFLLQS